MANKKKGGGMAGRNHPKDENGTTGIWWTHSMRRRTEFPDGAAIKVKFPEGANGKTWDKSTGVFTATLHGEKKGTYENWGAAAKALNAKVSKEEIAPTNGVSKAKVVAGATPVRRRRRLLTTKSTVVVDSTVITRAQVKDRGEDPTKVLVGMAEMLEAKARGFQLGAESIRQAISQL